MGFPHIAALFPDVSTSAKVAAVAKFDLVGLEDAQASVIPALRAANPDIIILWGYIAACEVEVGGTLASLPYEWILQQVGTTLSDDIDATTGTIPVTALVNGDLTLFAVGQKVLIGGEMVTVTGIGDTSLTVTRGVCYTATSHASGTRVAACASSFPGAVRMDMTDQCPTVDGDTWVTWRAADALSRCADTDLYDGVYIDLCGSYQAHIVGPDNVTKSIDYLRDNTPTADAYAAFNAAWNAGQLAFDTAIRVGLGDRLYLTNEFLDDYSLRNGTIFEGFPYMSGVDTGYPWNWATTMYGPRYVGYGDRIGTVTEWMTNCAEPNLTTLMESEDVAGVPDYQVMRYGLATSLIAGSYFMYNPPGSGFVDYPWFDEFDADLGEPVGDAYAVGTLGADILGGTGAFDGSWSGVWDTSVYGGAAATFDIDTSVKHSGAGSLHADITTVVEGASHVSFSYLAVPDLTLDTHYVVNFWAKASAPTTFAPNLREDVGYTSIVTDLDEALLTTEWQEFTRNITVTGSPTDLEHAYLSFVMGYAACEVWVDDFTIKPGSVACMRRNYDNGCVVVNPGDAEQTIAIDLGGRFVSNVTIPSRDGIVLLTPPPPPPHPTPPSSLAVTIQPFGATITRGVQPLAAPTMRYNIFGGMESADIPCVLEPYLADNIKLARVVIGGPEPFIGRAWSYDGGVLHILGPGVWASMQYREALYHETSTVGFETTTVNTASANIIVRLDDDGALRFCVLGGQQVAVAEFQRMKKYAPRPGGTRVVWHWHRPSTHYQLNLLSGVWGGGPASENVTWTAETTIAAESGANSGTAVTDIGSAYDYLAVQVVNQVAHTPGDWEECIISAVDVYGVPGVTSSDAHSVLVDHCAQAPSWGIPAGAPYRAWIGSPAGEIAPLLFPAETQEGTIPTELVKVASWDWGYYPERVAGIWCGLPHYTQRPTTPRYLIDVRRCLTPVGFASDMEPLASKVRVTYTDVKGRARYVDVVDTDPTHELVRRGIVKCETMTGAGITTASTATAFGNLFLADAGRDQVSATLPVDAVYTIAGARVPLRCVRPGALVRLIGIGRKPIDVIIRSVETDDATANIAVDSSPYRLDIVLARYDKRAAKWSTA